MDQTNASPKKLYARITRRKKFCAGHVYKNQNWSDSKNQTVFDKCFSKYGHGHNYTFEVSFQGPIDSETGMIINLKEVDHAMDSVVEELDHKFLNYDIPYFKDKIPTTENLAQYIFQALGQMFDKSKAQILKVRVLEGEDIWSDYGYLEV